MAKMNQSRKWTETEEAQLTAMLMQGKSYNQIGAVIDRTEYAIRKHLWAKNAQAKAKAAETTKENVVSTVAETTETILDVAKETATRLGYSCIARIEYRNTETQESATVRAMDNSGNAISVVIIKSGKEGAK